MVNKLNILFLFFMCLGNAKGESTPPATAPSTQPVAPVSVQLQIVQRDARAGDPLDLVVVLSTSRKESTLRTQTTEPYFLLPDINVRHNGGVVKETEYGTRMRHPIGLSFRGSGFNSQRPFIQTIPLSRLFDLSAPGRYSVEITPAVVDDDIKEFISVRPGSVDFELREK